jgi:hypothetical protein
MSSNIQRPGGQLAFKGAHSPESDRGMIATGSMTHCVDLVRILQEVALN